MARSNRLDTKVFGSGHVYNRWLDARPGEVVDRTTKVITRDLRKVKYRTHDILVDFGALNSKQYISLQVAPRTIQVHILMCERSCSPFQSIVDAMLFGCWSRCVFFRRLW